MKEGAIVTIHVPPGLSEETYEPLLSAMEHVRSIAKDIPGVRIEVSVITSNSMGGGYYTGASILMLCDGPGPELMIPIQQEQAE